MKRGLLGIGIFVSLFLISCTPAQKEPVSSVEVEQPSKETCKYQGQKANLNTYRYQQISVNSVKDSDLVPQ